MSARVFFPGPDGGRFNTDPAKLYGQVTFLIVDENPSPLNVERYRRLLLDGLDRHEFDPDVDYVAMTGTHLSVAMLFGFALSRYQRLKTLFFDARKGFYMERVIRIEETV